MKPGAKRTDGFLNRPVLFFHFVLLYHNVVIINRLAFFLLRFAHDRIV